MQKLIPIEENRVKRIINEFNEVKNYSFLVLPDECWRAPTGPRLRKFLSDLENLITFILILKPEKWKSLHLDNLRTDEFSTTTYPQIDEFLMKLSSSPERPLLWVSERTILARFCSDHQCAFECLFVLLWHRHLCNQELNLQLLRLLPVLHQLKNKYSYNLFGHKKG